MLAWRTFLVLAALVLAMPAPAATVAERSPFYQGHWWDPSRSGNGFEIFNSTQTVQVIWYTFDEAGKPIWYTAQGPESSIGMEAWPLLHHRWENGRKAEAVTVGTLRFSPGHPESANVAWSVGGRQGSWAIQPFRVAGAIPEVDHTGSWFDPANSGWGVSLTEQGDVLGGVIFTYDASGAPTWLSGFERGSTGSVAMFSATGSCPGCPLRGTVTQAAGRLVYEFASETRLTLRSQVNLVMANGVNADGASLVMLGRPASWRTADRELASFTGDAGLRDYLVAGMANLSSATPAIIVLPSASPFVPASTFSVTNLQEAGVDEADLVKTNGRQVYAYAHDAAGNRLPRIRIARVENAGGTLVTAGSVELGSGLETPMAESGLLLQGTNLVSVTGTRAGVPGFSPWWYSGSWLRGSTHVEVFDAANPEAPARRWRASIDGHLIATRRIGSRLYVVSRFAPWLSGYRYGVGDAASMEANRQLLAATPLADLLPKIRIDGGAASPAVTANAVFVPPQGERRVTAEITLVTAIDLDSPRVAQTLAVAGPLDTVYASPTNLYVASSRWAYRYSPYILSSQSSFYLTDIHQVRLTPQAMSFAGSGTVEGYLSEQADLAPFRLGEHEGRLRVVTSNNGMWGGASRNRLTILQPSSVSPGLLKTVSWLPNARRPEPLGKPGELVYGTRFVGDRLYAVTFRMTDPLYVVDLADSADPRIAGSLEIPGFSEYLHPLPNGLLLGFGKDAIPAGGGDWGGAWFQGLQLTLFDVSNAAAPRELNRINIGKRGSESALLRSHHAFSVLARPDGSTTIAIPAAVHEAPTGSMMNVSSTYGWSYSGVLRFELRGNTAADARLTQLPTTVTHRVGPMSGPANDPGREGGRTVQFTDGVIYSGNGFFWRGDALGNAAGPY